MVGNSDDAEFTPNAAKPPKPRHSNPPLLLGVVTGGIGVWTWWATGSWLVLLGGASLGLGWLARAVCRGRQDWGAAGFVLVAAIIPLGATIGHLAAGQGGEPLAIAGLVLGYPALLGCGLSWRDDVRRRPDPSPAVEFLVMAVTILVGLTIVFGGLMYDSFGLHPPRC